MHNFFIQPNGQTNLTSTKKGKKKLIADAKGH